MSTLAVVTSSPQATEGGHLVIARALVQAAHDSGHQASLVVTPDYGFGRTAATYWANWNARVGRVDRVISLRYPSYAVSHPAHVCWLNHTMREYYDYWPAFRATLSWRNKLKEGLRRRLLHAADRWLLGRVRVVAQSETIRQRLVHDFGRDVEVVHPPPPQRAYRCDGYEPYVLAVSRLTPLKRVDLLIRALAEPAAGRVRAVIAGDGDSRAELAALAASLGVAGRVTFLGHVDEAVMLSHLARCRAVCFTPLREDYGLVTGEAFASRKAVVTCRDSGGPAELVENGETGFVSDATPPALAQALARVTDDERLAERLGANAEARARRMTWEGALSRLLH